MSETTSARTERPRTGSARTQFVRGNKGKPKGTLDRRRLLGQAAAQALEGRAWDVLEKLLTSPSWRARHEAAKTTLAYSLGLPRQSLTIDGSFGDLSKELALALQAVRLRREAPALPAPAAEVPALDAEIVRGASDLETGATDALARPAEPEGVSVAAPLPLRPHD